MLLYFGAILSWFAGPAITPLPKSPLKCYTKRKRQAGSGGLPQGTQQLVLPWGGEIIYTPWKPTGESTWQNEHRSFFILRVAHIYSLVLLIGNFYDFTSLVVWSPWVVAMGKTGVRSNNGKILLQWGRHLDSIVVRHKMY